MARVLVAEDERALLLTYVELVEELGHECLQARDGNEALELCRRANPDVVVTDFMMPGKTGIELIRALSKDAVLATVPTVLMSAGRLSEAERKLPWRFLQKPVSLEQFEHTVSDALKQRRAPPARESFIPPARENASEISFAREEMLSWVSHEIKTPLSAAMTATQLALRKVQSGEPGPELEARLVLITRQLMRMDELVTSILDAAQLHEGKLTLDREQFLLTPWLRDVVNFWKETHPDYKLTVEADDGIVVSADRERLRQIVDNLISNAIKYGRRQKSVQIEVEQTEHELRLKVTDYGPGIAAEELPNLFDRFHRVPGQGGRGHGLGLYVASALARLHGGALSVRSEVERGSTFTLALPYGDEDAI